MQSSTRGLVASRISPDAGAVFPRSDNARCICRVTPTANSASTLRVIAMREKRAPETAPCRSDETRAPDKRDPLNASAPSRRPRRQKRKSATDGATPAGTSASSRGCRRIRKERDSGGRSAVPAGPHCVRCGSSPQAVLAIQWLWSLRRLWVAATNRHSDCAAALPLRMNRSTPRLYLICP
jgi:hypothetical protein